MIKLAGKYANAISRNPVASAVAGGLGAAGLATLGNVVSGEAQEEGPGRLGLEALGAGGLGAVLGAQIPGMRGKAAKAMRDLGTTVMNNPGSVAHRAKMTPNDILIAENVRDYMRQAVREGADPEQVRQQFKTGLRTTQGLINTAAIPLGLTAAGAAGGMIGGGVASLGQLVGIPGLNQDQAMQAVAQQAVDPEGYVNQNPRGLGPTTRQYGIS
jgi:hypothetical protein